MCFTNQARVYGRSGDNVTLDIKISYIEDLYEEPIEENQVIKEEQFKNLQRKNDHVYRKMTQLMNMQEKSLIDSNDFKDGQSQMQSRTVWITTYQLIIFAICSGFQILYLRRFFAKKSMQSIT